MSKLRRLSTKGIVPVEYADTFRWQRTGGLRWRLVIGPADDPVGLMRDLMLATWTPPYRLLYVLVASRTGREAGRYELTTTVDAAGLTAFLDTHGEFLAADSRHHFWICDGGGATRLVFDRHGLLFAYGRLLRIERLLRSRGFQRGAVSYPNPHVHEYVAAFDDAEVRLLTGHFWKSTPLQDGDER